MTCVRRRRDRHRAWRRSRAGSGGSVGGARRAGAGSRPRATGREESVGAFGSIVTAARRDGRSCAARRAELTRPVPDASRLEQRQRAAGHARSSARHDAGRRRRPVRDRLGARTSLRLAFIVVSITMVVGIAIGSLAGFLAPLGRHPDARGRRLPRGPRADPRARDRGRARPVVPQHHRRSRSSAGRSTPGSFAARSSTSGRTSTSTPRRSSAIRDGVSIARTSCRTP